MTDLIKKSILFGIGAIEVTKESVDKFVSKLVKEENLTPAEGKKVVESVMKDLNSKVSPASVKMKKMISQVLSELGVATKKDLEQLKKSLKAKK